MKRILSILLTLVLCFSCFPFFTVTAAEPEENVVYLDDGGDDTNDGTAADKAVKTFAKAQALLPATGGVIIIKDTYTQSAWGLGTAKAGATYTVRGAKADSASKFIQTRSVGMNVAITFDNLTYEITNTAWAQRILYAQCNRLEFTETVTCTPNANNGYAIIYGGSSAAITGNSELVFNGGTFHYVYGGSKSVAQTGSVSITVGGTASILDRIYGSGDGDLSNGVNITINGGTIAKEVLLAGGGGTVRGTSTCTVTGGTFPAIWCYGSNDSTNTGTINIDISNYEPAKTAGWFNISGVTDKTTVITADTNKAELEAPTIDVTSTLDVVFNATVSEGIITGEKKLVLNVNGTDIESDYNNGTEYSFTYTDLSPEKMGDKLTVKLNVVDGSTTTTRWTRAYTYADLAKAAKTADANLTNVVNALLRYGAAAQTYTGYNTENLVNAGLNADAWTALTDGGYTLTASTGTASLVSAGILHENVNKLYFDIASTSADFTVKIGNTELNVEDKGNGTYRASTEGIAASDMLDVITVTVCENDTVVQTLTYSVKAYAKALQGNDASADELAETYYLYCVAAAAASAN